MNVIRQLSDIDRAKSIALTAGSFDGVHLGHQALIRDALAQAEKSDGEAWLLTFDPHPARLLAPAKAPALLMTHPQRRDAFQQLGLSGVIELPFGQVLAETSPEDFIQQLVTNLPGLTSVTVGPNWTFGYHAQGTVDTLKELASRFGFEARVLSPVLDASGEMISSSRIRNLIGRGELPEAERLLGHPYVLSGIVTKGKQEGRELGFPTANIAIEQECHPAPGIYACTLNLQNRPLLGAGYFMPAKTEVPVFEVHLVGQDVDLYGQQIAVEVRKKVRDHEAFSEKTALISAIQDDIQSIQQWYEDFQEPPRFSDIF